MKNAKFPNETEATETSSCQWFHSLHVNSRSCKLSNIFLFQFRKISIFNLKQEFDSKNAICYGLFHVSHFQIIHVRKLIMSDDNNNNNNNNN